MSEAMCRSAFVARIKEENADCERWSRSSLKQHWSGPQHGFSDFGIQKRWLDFKAGWLANKSV